MSKPSYLDQAEEEQDLAERTGTTATASPPSVQEIDLSGLKPTPIVRPEALSAAVEEGRRRGFGGGNPVEPAASSRRATKPRGPKGARASSEAPAKRFIVSLDGEKPPAGIQGQIALSGDARVLYDFVRRAHYDRKPRGELLAEMLALYVEKYGATPGKY